jgi:hypothetical protein
MSAPSHTTETERELEALGEAPLSAEELALLAEAGDLADSDLAEVASVARLAELAEPFVCEDLSDLELHRSWRAVEQRSAQAKPQTEVQTQAKPAGGGPRRWLLAAPALIMAAALVLVVLQPFSGEQTAGRGDADAKPDAERVAQLGEQARATLRTLDDGVSDTQRAERIAAEYQRQLEEQGG